MLMLYNTDKRDPNYPTLPILTELGCRDLPPYGYLVIGPKGIPNAICKKLGETFKKVIEGPDFRRMLANADLPFNLKDQAQLEKEIPAQYEWFKGFYKEVGARKED